MLGGLSARPYMAGGAVTASEKYPFRIASVAGTLLAATAALSGANFQ